MKKRSMFLMSFALLLLLVVGGTMAWFTAESGEVVNTFKAGTVEIELHDDFSQEEGKDVLNVNPGDAYDKIVYVENTGTKRAYIRVQLTPEWTLVEGKNFPEELTSSTLTPAILSELGDNWIQIGDWYYYKEILNPVAEGDKDATSNLITEVKFDGPSMTSEYQGATFKLKVKAEAIQASNDAIKDEWKIDPDEWEAITE